MKHILTLAALVFTTSCFGQEACPPPQDSDGNGFIGSADLIDLLANFGDSDMDGDGIWDSEDECVGEYDECGACNGGGPQIPVIENIDILYDSVYADQIDEWLVFEVGMDTTFNYVCELAGCMDPDASNFNPYATEDDGSCLGNGPVQCDFLEDITYFGYNYDLIVIGDRCLFAENLRTEHYSNGDAIPALSASEWVSTDSGAQSVYSGNLLGYGRLYNWYAVDDSRGLCPAGWHVPSETEWIDMIATVESPQGNSLKSTNGWDPYPGCVNPCLTSTTCCPNGTNSSGFDGLPGGFRHASGNGSFDAEGDYGLWWSSTSYGGAAWYWSLAADMEGVNWQSPYSKKSGYSVRCIKDSE